MSILKALRTLCFSGTEPRSLAADVGLTVLRVFTGLSMAFAHGLGKIQGPSEGLVATVTQLQFPAPGFFAWMVAITEFVGGILLAVGLLTRINAAMLCFTMLVAGLAVHGYLRPDDTYRDMELALLFAAVAFAFTLTGSGRFSIDKALR